MARQAASSSSGSESLIPQTSQSVLPPPTPTPTEVGDDPLAAVVAEKKEFELVLVAMRDERMACEKMLKLMY